MKKILYENGLPRLAKLLKKFLLQQGFDEKMARKVATKIGPMPAEIRPIKFPKNIQELADKFRKQRLEEKRIENKKKLERERNRRQVRADRLKTGLDYAKKIFQWANSFRKSRIGKELMRKSHIPTAYSNIFFFDGRVEEVDWVGLVINPKGLRVNHGGRYSTFTEKLIKSASDLAASVDTKILKMASEWIDNGKVWDCILRRFGYLEDPRA